MPDDTPDDGDDEGVTPDPDAGAKKALEAERKARREAEKAKTALEKRLQEIEDRDKTESEKVADALKASEARAEKAEADLLRLTVASDKGLTPAQAKRLVGATKEELEADADEILEHFPAQGVTPPPDRRPSPDLRGGGDPTAPEEPDIRAVVEAIPRGI